MSKFTVFVYDNAGHPHAHGPARASEAQARSVARLLSRRLGWATVWATETPADLAADATGPTPAEATCSPVWKNAALAARWEAAAK